jgi:prepilin peptidase CpaA
MRTVLDGMAGLLGSLAGAVLVGLVPYLLFTFSRGRGIGGGDVKLFAALGAWLGPSLGVEVQFLAFACLLFWAFGLLAWRGRLLAVLGSTLRLAFGWALPKRWRRAPAAETLTSLRMGPAIAAGTVGVSCLELLGSSPWAG